LPSVVCDNTSALQEAAEHLAGEGHSKIALLAGPADAWAATKRVQAVHAWARTASDVEVIELGPYEAQFADGRHAAAEVVAMGATAVLAFDDLMACGVLAGLADHGKSVPGDISVVGCDDVLIAQTVTPALSTVTAPIHDLGWHAIDLLTKVIGGESVRNVSLRGTLTLRGTTRAAR
jgi:LacI family transcriptional regulator